MIYVHANERVCTPLNNKDMCLAHINLIMFIMMIIYKKKGGCDYCFEKSSHVKPL